MRERGQGRRAMSGVGIGFRVSGGISMLVVALGVALAFGMAPAAAAAGVVGTVDSTFGNAPVALVTGAGGTAYNPGGLTALPGGSSLVADEGALGLTELSSDGVPMHPRDGCRGRTRLIACVMTKRDDGRAPSAAHDKTLSAAVCSIEPTK